jgi:hypothetical protein
MGPVIWHHLTRLVGRPRRAGTAPSSGGFLDWLDEREGSDLFTDDALIGVDA